MLKQISMRIPEEIYNSIEKLSKLEKTEKSLILREALQNGIDKIKKDVAVEMYREDKLSLSEAAELTQLSIPEMMDLLIQRGVKSKISLDDLKEDMNLAEEII